jgi:hypothetical protein
MKLATIFTFILCFSYAANADVIYRCTNDVAYNNDLGFDRLEISKHNNDRYLITGFYTHIDNKEYNDIYADVGCDENTKSKKGSCRETSRTLKLNLTEKETDSSAQFKRNFTLNKSNKKLEVMHATINGVFVVEHKKLKFNCN